ncbi:MAG: sigma-54 interaction domain-containing protein [Steroidobacteraceae bacterium]
MDKHQSLQAVIYDCDVERAAQLGELLRQLHYQPLVMDHAALVSTVLQAGKSEQVLMIGDVADLPDWSELGAALREALCDVSVISYGSTYIADELAAVAGAQRITRLRFPFTAERLAQALHHPLVQAEQDTGPLALPTGVSPAIREVNRLIRQVAVHGSSVLILGESGSGKELVAHAVHDASPRRQRSFVAINCGAIPSELLESELFGHEKGAFTGAITARKGRFEIAEGGTLFLDEIGDMSMTMQVKLLRVLQERVFERVGSHTPIRCNVRIIAATHRNLEECISKGSFREDLYYRLNVFPIEMPPLRERGEDLPLLINDFIKMNAANGRARLQFQSRAMAALAGYSWPGNVRELANLVERLSILCPTGKVDVVDLPARYRPKDWQPELSETEATDAQKSNTQPADATADTSFKWQLSAIEQGVLPDEQALLLMDSSNGTGVDSLPARGLDLRTHLYDIERTLIRQALERSGGTVAQAARLLQLRRTTLVEKLRKFELLDDRVASEI